LLDVHFTFESPKVAVNSSRIVSKLFESDDWPSSNSANHVSVMPDNDDDEVE
jgi:hypothetical protein